MPAVQNTPDFVLTEPNLSRACVEQPESAIMPTRRMGHRKALRHDLVGSHINNDAAIRAVIAPTIGHVARSDRRDISRFAVLHGQTIEVAAIFRCQS